MKKRKKLSRFKIQRRLLTELPGLGKQGAMERKPYPPGQHGGKRIKYSDYRLQLEEKQKLKFNYDLREEQLLRLVKLAKKRQENWIKELAGLLESRLQNVIFRGGFARSQMSASQMISHKQVCVNGKKVSIRSYQLKPGDIIELTSKGLQNQIFLTAQKSPRLPLPEWLLKEETNNQVKLIYKEKPGLEAIPFLFDASLVTSYYSKA